MEREKKPIVSRNFGSPEQTQGMRSERGAQLIFDEDDRACGAVSVSTYTLIQLEPKFLHNTIHRIRNEPTHGIGASRVHTMDFHSLIDPVE